MGHMDNNQQKKNLEKKQFLETFFFWNRQLINIEEMCCLLLNRIRGTRFQYCETHLKNAVCALNYAHIYIYTRYS